MVHKNLTVTVLDKKYPYVLKSPIRYLFLLSSGAIGCSSGKNQAIMYQMIIVEDEDAIRDGLVFLLPWEDLGFQISGSFSSGEEALAFLCVHPVHAILTDIRLGGMDGISLAREARGMLPEVEIVFLTGYRDFEYARQAVKYGIREYLLKPVKHAEMVMTFLNIRSLLDERNPGRKEEREKGNGDGYYDRLIGKVQKHVEENIRTVTLESASIAVNLSTSYFSRLFKEKAGENFSDFCMRKRMELAAHFLLQNDKRTYEIAYLTGYDNPKNFTRAFKHYFGVSPREYRDGNTLPPEEAP